MRQALVHKHNRARVEDTRLIDINRTQRRNQRGGWHYGRRRRLLRFRGGVHTVMMCGCAIVGTTPTFSIPSSMEVL